MNGVTAARSAVTSDGVASALLPDPTDELSCIASRCLLAVRAWAVQREAGDDLIPMDCDLPWTYLGGMLRDIGSVRAVAAGVTEPPTISIGGLRYEPASMPDDITDRIANLLDQFR